MIKSCPPAAVCTQFISKGLVSQCLLVASRPGEKEERLNGRSWRFPPPPPRGAQCWTGEGRYNRAKRRLRARKNEGRSSDEAQAAGQLAALDLGCWAGAERTPDQIDEAGRHRQVADIMRQRVDWNISRRNERSSFCGAE